MRILAVIPARGGSKGIPRKNVRLIHGKPLIYYAIHNALQCPMIDDCVVSTDDDEIRDIASAYGAKVIKREDALAEDQVTLDPVVYDAVNKIEKTNNISYDIVITLQPTSPLLNLDTLINAIYTFINGGKDTMISVVNHPHLTWKQVDERIVPNYERRLNRQQLPPNYMETGAFFITQRRFVTKNSRLGKDIAVYEVPQRESVDIDSTEDWLVAESILNKKNIILRCDGTAKLGLGHIYNCLTMAFDLIEHNVLLLTKRDSKAGIAKIKETHLPYQVINSDEDIGNIIDQFKPDIWVNDCLNTSSEYMRFLKTHIRRVVSIEDLGGGTRYADAVINALYEGQGSLCKHTYEGADYIFLRNEFQMENPIDFCANVRNILVMFGGTDPSNLNKKIYQAALNLHDSFPSIEFHFLTGIGYDAEKNGVYENSGKGIFVHRNVSKVTSYMKNADLAITSQGRTIYEIASMGIPSVVLAQNHREMMHAFATMKNGFLNLGLGHNISESAIVNTLKWLIDTPNVRKNMRELMLKHDFRGSNSKVKGIILGDVNEK